MTKSRAVVPFVLASVVAAYWLWLRPSAQEPIPALEARSEPQGRNKIQNAARTPSTFPVADEAPAIRKAAAAPLKAPYTEKEIQEIRVGMRVSLAALYGAQKSFFSEYNRYASDFDALGYSPEEKVFRFNTGFLRPYYPSASRSTPVEREAQQIHSYESIVEREIREMGQAGHKFSPEMQNVRLEEAASFCRNSCTASETQFEMISVANLDEDPDLDVWLMNDKKELVQVQDDLAPQSY